MSIPPNPSSIPSWPKKRLIVCCDGTWKTDDVAAKALSNVARIARCIADVDDWHGRFVPQIVYYQSGVGMGTGKVANVHDGLTGRGLSRTIRQAYSFICLNWSSDSNQPQSPATKDIDVTDEIVLIGFSRGAFAVRCLAQFVHDVGLLTKSGLRHLPKLFKIWKHCNDDLSQLEEECRILEEWKELRRAPKVKIKACAVWDTVSTIGMPVFAHIPRRPRRTYTRLGKGVTPNIELAIQALALDETRRHFEPEVWVPPPEGSGQKLIQRWFAGCHADIGGDERNTTLATICLAWMVGQLTDTLHFNVHHLWTITTTRDWSMPTPEAATVEDLPDRCKVVATSALSRDLLQSRVTFSSATQRLLGGSILRRPTHGEPHYSVCIFDNLGISLGKDYRSRFPKSVKFDLLDVVPPLSSKAGLFEGEILKKWTKLILCAHVNIRQSRNSTEVNAVIQRTPDFHVRRSSSLGPSAFYENTVPVTAILSTFHKIARRYGVEDSSHLPIDKLKELTQLLHKFEQRDKKIHKKYIPKYTFEKVEEAVEVSDNEVELEIRNSEAKPVLVFTRTFPLLMGRPHGVDGEVQGVPPCERCKSIWTSPSAS